MSSGGGVTRFRGGHHGSYHPFLSSQQHRVRVEIHNLRGHGVPVPPSAATYAGERLDRTDLTLSDSSTLPHALLLSHQFRTVTAVAAVSSE